MLLNILLTSYSQIYCFDAVTLENKFSVLTYPLQGAVGVNVGYGPMAVGPRWLAYSSNNPLLSNTGRLSPQNLTPSPGVSPSTSPGNGSLVARYAMESSKQLAAGILNLGDMGYKTLSKYYQELLPDGSSSPLSANSSRRFGRVPSTAHPSEADNAGMVSLKTIILCIIPPSLCDPLPNTKIECARAHTHTHRERRERERVVSFRKDSRPNPSHSYNPTTSECKMHSVEVDLHYFK